MYNEIISTLTSSFHQSNKESIVECPLNEEKNIDLISLRSSSKDKAEPELSSSSESSITFLNEKSSLVSPVKRKRTFIIEKAICKLYKRVQRIENLLNISVDKSNPHSDPN